MKFIRKDNWDERLFSYLDSKRTEPWHDVQHNCCTFAAGAIRAMTDQDPAGIMGLDVASPMDVARVLVENGGVQGLATKLLGEPIAILQAGRGDIVMKQGDPGDTLGVVVGARAIFVNREAGFQMRELMVCKMAWRV